MTVRDGCWLTYADTFLTPAFKTAAAVTCDSAEIFFFFFSLTEEDTCLELHLGKLSLLG